MSIMSNNPFQAMRSNNPFRAMKSNNPFRESAANLAPPSNVVDDYTYGTIKHDHSATVIQYHNHNNGRGMLNHIHGNQEIQMNIILSSNDKRSSPNDTVTPIIEPYKSVIESLMEIRQLLQDLPSRRSVFIRRELVDGFIKMVVCAANAMEIIRDKSPGLYTLTFFLNVENQAWNYGKSLQQLKIDMGKFRDHLFNYMDTGLYRPSDTNTWPSLCHRLDSLIRANQASLERLLRLLLDPEYRHITGDKHAELMRVVSHTGFSPSADIRHLEVQTIWIRSPTSLNMYAVPLSFCTSLWDMSLVIHHYFQDRPEGDYIDRGEWELVRDADDRVIKETSLPNVIKPGATFDISIVIYEHRTQPLTFRPCCQPLANIGQWTRCTVCETVRRKVTTSWCGVIRGVQQIPEFRRMSLKLCQ